MIDVRIALPEKSYSITIEFGLINRLPDLLLEAYSGKKLALVTDTRVYRLYGRDFAESLKDKGLQVVPVVFEEGEQNKNLATLAQIYARLAEHAFTRSDSILAFGGGVTGDMAGLAAATFLRGLRFIQIPTTLLAMVDSSIGGKVAVDLPQGKNLVGAFYQPDHVYADPMLLQTLDDRRFSDGLAELLKHGFIRDAGLIDEINRLGSRSGLEPHMDELIKRSCEIKGDVVSQDERDNGVRQLLNFGHTVGHAIEKVQHFKGFSHGEAISAGMVLMTRITESMGITMKGTTEKIRETLHKFNLPVEMPEVAVPELIEAMRVDKKLRSGKITIVCLERMGKAVLKTLNLEELEGMIIGALNH
jgi:3-dehydroquinate synthase